MGRLGGMAVLNLEGIQTRYESPDEVVEQIISSSAEEATRIIQSIYGEPSGGASPLPRSEIGRGRLVIVPAIPQRRWLAEDAGADFHRPVLRLTARHRHRVRALDFRRLKRELPSR
jgi:IMP dehydrogenase